MLAEHKLRNRDISDPHRTRTKDLIFAKIVKKRKRKENPVGKKSNFQNYHLTIFKCSLFNNKITMHMNKQESIVQRNKINCLKLFLRISTYQIYLTKTSKQ